VFVERLDWLATHPRFTPRFALHVGAPCRELTNTAVAKAECLHDSTVKDLDRIYRQQQVACAGLPAAWTRWPSGGARRPHRRQ